MQRKNRLALAAALIVLTLAADRVTKEMAVAGLRFQDSHSYLGGLLRLEYAENTGGFLSLGSTLPPAAHFVIFVLAVILFLAAVALILVRSSRLGRMEIVGLALVAAGGLGNLWDRLFHDGTVVDFLLLGYRGIQTGIFNVADIAITTGVVLLLGASFRKREEEPRATATEYPPAEGQLPPPPPQE